MSDDLGPLSRGLLDAARDGLGPDAAAQARVRAKIAAAVAVGGVGIGLGASGGAAAAAGNAAKLSLLGKLGAVLAAATVIGGVAVVAQRGGLRSAPEPEVAPVLAPAARIADVRHERLDASTQVAVEELPPERVADGSGEREAPSGTSSDANVEIAPAPVAPAAPHPSVRTPRVAIQLPAPPPAAAAAPSVGPEPPTTTLALAPAAPEPAPVPAPRARPAHLAALAREVDLVDSAATELRGGHATAALATVAVYDEETGGAGQLAEDAAAIEIEALCRLGDRTALAKLAAFDARWPTSAERGHAAAACK